MTKIVNVIEFYPQDIYNSKDIQVTFDNGIIFFFYYIKIRHFSSNWFRLSVTQFSHPVMSDSLRPHELQHDRPPCPSPTPGAFSNSCLLSWWCHPTISSSAVLFSSCLQSFPASRSFQISQFFASGGQSIRVSASSSVLPMNIQD